MRVLFSPHCKVVKPNNCISLFCYSNNQYAISHIQLSHKHSMQLARSKLASFMFLFRKSAVKRTVIYIANDHNLLKPQ